MNVTAETPVGGLVAALGLDENFRPSEPTTIEETGLSEVVLEELIAKFLLALGSESGRGLADRLHVPLGVLEGTIHSMRNRQLITPLGSAALNDHRYGLTDQGRALAQSAMQSCAYMGPAPVTLADYVVSVEAQTVRAEHPKRRDLESAFGDIYVDEHMFDNLGPAINAGRGMFLYGPPGNGKTTLATRITKCFGQDILVPYSIVEDGQVIKFYDAASHVAVKQEHASILKTSDCDRRWIRIRRPTVVVGGELTMESLELKHDSRSNVAEASLQLKSNCGCLLIDDFGRQLVEPAQLLNRWIVPLENRIDYLTLATGKKIEVPFDQLIIFSTNLEPSDLADDAFLRRIPYKIEVGDPTRDEFHVLFKAASKSADFDYDPAAVDYLIDTHYTPHGRPLRRCQPRDLMTQMVNFCEYHERPANMSPELFDRAVEVYFTVMGGK